MLELLLLISYFNLSNFPDNIYYREEITQSSSLSDDFLTVNYFYNGYFLYSEHGKSLDDWSNEFFNSKFRALLAEKMQKIAERTGTGATEGLVPDVDLDLKMPRGLSYIIGEGGHLKVDGFQDIGLEVKQNRQTYGEYGSYSSFPQILLDMRLKLDVDGTIGEKLHVDIDHDSDLAEQDNLLRIWYGGAEGGTVGTEDDIIQELHLGRISETGSEKLFGIATRGKIGSTSFDLSAGKLESDEVTGSDAINISSRVDTINERDYLRNEYFYTGLPHSSDSLIAYGLFKDHTGDAKLYNLMKFNGDTIGDVYFIELVEREAYELGEFLREDKAPLPYFHILNPYGISGRRLGVYLIFADSTGKIDTLGDLTGDKHTLYQLKSINPDPGDPSWNYQMRNIYPLGNREPSRVEIDIYKIVSGGNNSQTNSRGDEYAEVLGITTEEGNVISSQILWKDGCLVFPDRFPFLNPGLGVDTVPKIYRQKTLYEDDGKTFDIVIATTSSASGSFPLRSSGEIIEGSEILKVDGRKLQRDTDYKIDYVTGQVELLNKETLPPDAEITYEFKCKPYFSFDSKYKTRFNIKAEPIEDSRLNVDFGFLSRSDKGVYHPPVGKEPSNITQGEVDFSLNKEPKFLSRAFASLPFVDEDSKSHFNIDGSYGFSLPNPATNGESYLDDMESIEQAVSVRFGELSWYYCSRPDSSVNVEDLAKLDWFTDDHYPKSRIFSEYANTSYKENRTSVMVLYFQPDNVENWGGIMRTFDSEYNFSQGNFLEVWIKAEEGEMIFEMGDRMVEDQIRWGRSSAGADSIIPPNGKWDTEDKNLDGRKQPGEDAGLDGIKMDDDNWVYDPDSLDDGVDDYVFGEPETFDDSLRLHNKEGNGKLDSEDLNGDYTFERENSFFRYKINLASPEYLSKEGLNGWKVFVIPLKDSLSFERIGNPSFESILYTRVWFKGMDTDTRITIGKIDIVGSKWRDKGVRFLSNDSLNSSGGSFRIGFRNTREDDDYIHPVKLIREPGSYTYQKEQSLSFQIDSLFADNYCLIENYLELALRSGGKGYDFRLYKELVFYTQYKGDASDSAEVFIRLLTDSSNYYQFNTFVYKNNWDTVGVLFDNFTDLKVAGDTSQGRYSIKGKPSLQNISFLQLGVANNTSETLKGEVLIDDIILKGADNRLGSNVDLSISTNVGDLITGLSYNVSRKSSNYKSRLDALRELGDRKVASQDFSITADAGKLVNKVVSFPISYSVGENHGTPIYKVNSDVKLSPEEAELLTDQQSSKNITFSLSRPSPSENWFLKHTIDNLKLSGSYRKSGSFTPLKDADTTMSTTGSVNYSLRMPKLSPPVFAGQSSSLLPSSIGLKTSYEYNKSESYNYKDSLYEEIDVPVKKEITSYATLTYEPIRWIDVDYSITTKNDLRERESFSENFSLTDLGQDAALNEEISATHRSSQFGVNNLNVTYRTSFSQNHEIEYAKTLGDSLDVRGCSQQRTLRLNDDLKIGSILDKIPFISRFAKNISPLRFSANFGKDGTFAYLNSMPGYKFRYGIETVPESSLFERVEKTDGGYIDHIYSLSSGFSSSIINLKVNWRKSFNKPDNLQRENTQSPKETITLTTFPKYIPKFAFFPEIAVPKYYLLPEIEVDFPNIQKYIPFLDNYVRRATLSFSISQDSSKTEGLGDKEFSSGDYSLSFLPAFDIDFKNGLGVKVTYQYNTNKVYPDSKLNTRGKTNGLRVNCDYTLKPSSSGFPLLFFGRIKFDKPVYLSASFSYKNTIRYRTDVYGEEALSDDTRNIEFNLQGRYTFSNMVSGGLTINFTNYLNRRLEDMSSTSYGGSFNVKLNF
jgi:hypothetical protein